jgi:hypothetical protein
LTPQRRFHHHTASVGGAQLYPTSSSPGSLRSGNNLSGSARHHYRSEHGTDKVETSKSWRRSGDDDANSKQSSQVQSTASSQANSPKASNQAESTSFASANNAASRSTSPTKTEAKE